MIDEITPEATGIPAHALSGLKEALLISALSERVMIAAIAEEDYTKVEWGAIPESLEYLRDQFKTVVETCTRHETLAYCVNRILMSHCQVLGHMGMGYVFSVDMDGNLSETAREIFNENDGHTACMATSLGSKVSVRDFLQKEPADNPTLSIALAALMISDMSDNASEAMHAILGKLGVSKDDMLKEIATKDHNRRKDLFNDLNPHLVAMLHSYAAAQLKKISTKISDPDAKDEQVRQVAELQTRIKNILSIANGQEDWETIVREGVKENAGEEIAEEFIRSITKAGRTAFAEGKLDEDSADVIACAIAAKFITEGNPAMTAPRTEKDHVH